MPRIELAPEVLTDFERILDHFSLHQSPNGPAHIADIIRAIDILAHSPLIGRPRTAALRELLIGRRPQAYIALYRFAPTLDTVFILAIRSHRESDYK
jgi:plasmid stabilization system protein ParE